MAKIKETKSKEFRAVGRRKCASARVRIDKGTGKIVVNGKPLNEYLPYFEMQSTVLAPLKALSKDKDLDILCV
jgi:small subunit ribosomal protein S9